MTPDSAHPEDSDQTMARVTNEIWKEVKTALHDMPLDECACKAEILEELKAGTSRELSKAALLKAITDSPLDYLDLRNPFLADPDLCVSRGSVCLSMLSH